MRFLFLPEMLLTMSSGQILLFPPRCYCWYLVVIMWPHWWKVIFRYRRLQYARTWRNGSWTILSSLTSGLFSSRSTHLRSYKYKYQNTNANARTNMNTPFFIMFICQAVNKQKNNISYFVAFYVLFERLSWSFQQKSSCFSWLFVELSTKVILLL